MSSIIKTGCAPSNTPDGKYFLQTDQACFAELKRNRTYICTAQEEAKVSHYVIITNADFTVTFNGDSDLIQVGRANNAIVMNVHRACRIDFVQGGNLEFKEGTAEFSSRIEMGVNASGNVLVASTLPQQGDFAGQICSLTTGATYVWTGSEWSSTAGSATLPTPTAANKGYLLASTGAAWQAQVNARQVFCAGTPAGSNIYVGCLLYTVAEVSNEQHLAFNVQCGTHGDTSRWAHVDIRTTTNSAGEFTRVAYAVNYAQSYRTSISKMENCSGLIKIFYKNKDIYIGVKAYTTRYTAMSLFDIVYGGDTITFNYGVPAFTTIPSDATEGICGHEGVSVPVSTAANQMLVSDGNGGWNSVIRRIQALENGENSGTNASHSVGKWCYKKIASHTNTSGHARGQLTCRYTLGMHNKISVTGDIKIEGIFTSGSSSRAISYTITENPSYKLPPSTIGNGTVAYLSQMFYLKFFIADSDGKSLYVAWSPIDSEYLTNDVKLTLDGLIYDGGDWTFETTTTWDALDVEESALPAHTTCSVADTHYMVPPATTTADNGKVLKVVNGVPTWSAS